ncbi:MAG: heme exporter protein CcmD [Limnohabitans sp.]|nr:heme exporter protein CcmD [Limnohabitans sp.]
MRWNNWAEFWAMGGYALYVWGSVGLTFLLMMAEVWVAKRRHQQTLSVLQINHPTTTHQGPQ